MGYLFNKESKVAMWGNLVFRAKWQFVLQRGTRQHVTSVTTCNHGRKCNHIWPRGYTCGYTVSNCGVSSSEECNHCNQCNHGKCIYARVCVPACTYARIARDLWLQWLHYIFISYKYIYSKCLRV